MIGLDWRTYLIQQKGWQDTKGNIVSFSDCDLEGKKTTSQIWIYLDEGLRCGGMHRAVENRLGAIKDALLGCGKIELWQCICDSMEGENIHVCREIDRSTDT